MKIEIEYPEVSVKRLRRYKFIKVLKVILVLLSLAAVIVNIAVGGKAWSAVACWSVVSFWRIFLSPDLVEFNLISQTLKPLVYVSGILLLIDLLLTPDEALFIIPIVAFGLLLLAALFFFIDVKRRMYAAMPIIWTCIFAMAVLVLGLTGVLELTWPVIVLGCVGLGLTLIGFIAFGSTLVLELKKRFHLR